MNQIILVTYSVLYRVKLLKSKHYPTFSYLFKQKALITNIITKPSKKMFIFNTFQSLHVKNIIMYITKYISHKYHFDYKLARTLSQL